ncbi:MAG: winged helix DNA-binding domain-containing protein [Oscillospiraceae bacterium]|nr:winged helix DNA-binding domain-containing protein [Oscillospiraceae bacterium]
MDGVSAASIGENGMAEFIIRRRMHGLYLSRKRGDLLELARELLGMHSWFYRNVCFSALIRGADIYGWKESLTKTWLYRGTLHAVAYDELPTLLALHTDESYLDRWYGREIVEAFEAEVVRRMEDGVYSRAEFRRIFANDYDAKFIEAMFSPWGGVFVRLARQGRVAFRDMASRDFDLISAEPAETREEVLPGLLRRYFTVYGPATIADAAQFFGFWKADARALRSIPLDDLDRFTLNKQVYYYSDIGDTADIPETTLLSGFDPYIVSYADRSASLPIEYKKRVILSSGICLPTIAVNGCVAGLWNIKGRESVVEFFEPQPPRIERAAQDAVETIRRRAGIWK